MPVSVDLLLVSPALRALSRTCSPCAPEPLHTHTHTERNTRWSVSTTSICQPQYHISMIIASMIDWTSFPWLKSLSGNPDTKDEALLKQRKVIYARCRNAPRFATWFNPIPSSCFELCFAFLEVMWAWSWWECDGWLGGESRESKACSSIIIIIIITSWLWTICLF